MLAVAVLVGVFSLIPFLWLVLSAMSEGFGFFVLPLTVLELMFLLAVFLVYRALSGDEDLYEPPSRRGFTPPPESSGRAAPTTQRPWTPAAPAPSDSRLSAWADWWFHGLQRSRER